VQFIRNRIYLQEIKSLKTIKITAGKTVYKVALKSLANAKRIERFLAEYVHKYIGSGNLFLYSYWTDDSALALILYKRKHPETHVFSRMHAWDLYFERNIAHYLPYRSLLLKESDAIFVISEHGINYLQNKFGIERCNKLKLSRLGTLNPFTDNILSKEKNIDILRIASCSAVVKLKRLRLIIDALSKIKEGIQIQWDHIGGGPFFEETLAYANTHISGNKNITYCFHGNIGNAEVIDFYHKNNIDLFINVSETEGLPVSIMEAISFGFPVLATGVGGVPEIVKDGYNGFLLHTDPTAEGIAENIVRFIKLPEEKKAEMRRNSFRIWKEKFNAEKNFGEFVQLVNAL
jgi:colanic acid/amylovoran biosynthesis glycosyltransferase